MPLVVDVLISDLNQLHVALGEVVNVNLPICGSKQWDILRGFASRFVFNLKRLPLLKEINGGINLKKFFRATKPHQNRSNDTLHGNGTGTGNGDWHNTRHFIWSCSRSRCSEQFFIIYRNSLVPVLCSVNVP